VPSTLTNKVKPQLAQHEVYNPDLEWGQYVLHREWDEKEFIRSRIKAETTPSEKLQQLLVMRPVDRSLNTPCRTRTSS